ncbi:uncharacterized protein PV07_05980 [Cladophialophora immunda]|uniref:Uncharacterized protein n=1 Tax=Cladophialophora immunda TaxID=569365 RepID=A0A0D1ZQC2_9EURO|nr:uncharacterized protein PV07_05980 [Cladophialophora immunda]KIW30221.1 hypothetical protein PV07_05980 [Cladophialophora immunda]
MSHSLLLTLPPELRRHIFQHYFELQPLGPASGPIPWCGASATLREVTCLSGTVKTILALERRGHRGRLVDVPTPTRLFLVCRRIYGEAVALFYGSLMFTIDPSISRFSPSSLSQVMGHTAGFLRKVQIDRRLCLRETTDRGGEHERLAEATTLLLKDAQMIRRSLSKVEALVIRLAIRYPVDEQDQDWFIAQVATDLCQRVSVETTGWTVAHCTHNDRVTATLDTPLLLAQLLLQRLSAATTLADENLHCEEDYIVDIEGTV